MALQALQNGVQDYLVEGQGDGDLISRAIRYAIERIRAEERLAYISRYAHLTGLADRVLFQTRPRRALEWPTATGRWRRSCSWTSTVSRPTHAGCFGSRQKNPTPDSRDFRAVVQSGALVGGDVRWDFVRRAL